MLWELGALWASGRRWQQTAKQSQDLRGPETSSSPPGCEGRLRDPSQVTVAELGLRTFCGEVGCPLCSVGEKAGARGGSWACHSGGRQGRGRAEFAGENPQKRISSTHCLTSPRITETGLLFPSSAQPGHPAAEDSSGASPLLAVALANPGSECVRGGGRGSRGDSSTGPSRVTQLWTGLLLPAAAVLCLLHLLSGLRGPPSLLI